VGYSLADIPHSRYLKIVLTHGCNSSADRSLQLAADDLMSLKQAFQPTRRVLRRLYFVKLCSGQRKPHFQTALGDFHLRAVSMNDILKSVMNPPDLFIPGAMTHESALQNLYNLIALTSLNIVSNT
jgi:hypothetical protein